MPHFGPPEKSLCFSFPGKNANRDPHKHFQGDFWGQREGPKRAVFGHKKFNFIFFLPLLMAEQLGVHPKVCHGALAAELKASCLAPNLT